MFHHWFSGRKLTFFLAETSAIAMACAVGAVLFAHALAPAGARAIFKTGWPALIILTVGAVIAFQFALYLLDLYNLRVAGEDRTRGQRMMKAAGAAAILLGGGNGLARLQLPPGAAMGAAMGAVFGVLLVRAAMNRLVGQAAKVLIVGDGAKARALSQVLMDEGEDSFQIVGFLPPSRFSSEVNSLADAAKSLKAEFVVTAIDDARGGVKGDALLECRLQGFNVFEGPRFMERVLRRIPVSSLRASDLAFSDEMQIAAGRSFFKRVFDILMSLGLLFFAWPVMLIVSIVIKLDSKGPVFYRQERVGLAGKSFFLWKFRSMRTDAEKDGAVWAKQNDDRVTRVGKFIRKTRIDEIPQIFNVLAGEMSFVGPRPERPVFVAELKQKIPFYGLRDAVKPGLTGWAQIRYPYGASVEDAKNKLEYDLYYIKNGSLFLDVACIFHTVRHVLVGRGAR
ncbi:MAG: TIGR03013 family XrtA/PEP-CTERM system glycosyltransferase [Myxococcaceae bacterium]